MQAPNYQRPSWQLTLIELIVDIMAFVEDDRMYVFEELIEGHKHRMWVVEELIGRSQLSHHAAIGFPVFDLAAERSRPVVFV